MADPVVALLTLGTSAYIDATEAAEVSHQHGQHLGELLSRGFPNLEKVQLVAHSAGTWAARATARYLLQALPSASVQITLLDPFVPAAVMQNTALSTNVVSSIAGNQQLKMLENYYAEDLITGAATQQQFAWRSTDVNFRIYPASNSQNTYSSHSGPIKFYADTVLATLSGQTAASSLAPFDVRPTSSARIGWTRGLFYNEPLILQSPQSQSSAPGASLTISTTANSRNGVLNSARDTSLTYVWRRNGVVISGATSSDLRIIAVQAADAGEYSVTVSNFAGSSTSTAATLTVTAATVGPGIVTQPINQSAIAGGNVTFTVGATGTAPLSYQWQKNGSVLSGATGSTLNLAGVQSNDAGDYAVVVTNSGGSIRSASASLTVRLPVTAPTITGQPASKSVAAGASAIFAAEASSTTAMSFQWWKDGIPFVGATNTTLILSSVSRSDAGSYSVVVTNSGGSVTSAVAVLTITEASQSRLINLSILTTLSVGESMTMGTVVGGAETSGPKMLVARAAGPSLAPFGVINMLPDPTMTVSSTSSTPATTIAVNNDWGGTVTLTTAFTQVGAFPYASSVSKDAAVVLPALAKGNYTVQVRDAGSGAGTVIAEVYDATPVTSFDVTTPRLINVSVLKQVGAGEVLTVGFVVGGVGSKPVLIRAVGPGLSQLGVSGVMADPQVTLNKSGFAAPLTTNNDWGGAAPLVSAFANVGAFMLSATSKDAALLITLQPGNYTAQVSGASGTAGLVLIEVYEVP